MIWRARGNMRRGDCGGRSPHPNPPLFEPEPQSRRPGYQGRGKSDRPNRHSRYAGRGKGGRRNGCCARGFTLIEFLVAFGIIAILVAIILPYLEKYREDARRTDCADHLRSIGAAFLEYGQVNESNYIRPLPEAPYDAVHKLQGYTAFTGPDGGVKANDITASLWLLLRGGYVKDLSTFVCPSTGDQADTLTDATGKPASALQRWNFRLPGNLSYSYDSPFTDALKQAFSGDRLREECAVLADRNPGFDSDGDRVLGPARMRRRLNWRRGIRRITSMRGRMCCIHRGMFRLNGHRIAGLGTTIFIRRSAASESGDSSIGGRSWIYRHGSWTGL